MRVVEFNSALNGGKNLFGGSAANNVFGTKLNESSVSKSASANNGQGMSLKNLFQNLSSSQQTQTSLSPVQAITSQIGSGLNYLA